MPATTQERSKASRIRRRIKAGKASVEDMAWLDEYEQRRDPAAILAHTADPAPPRGPSPFDVQQTFNRATTPHESPQPQPQIVGPDPAPSPQWGPDLGAAPPSHAPAGNPIPRSVGRAAPDPMVSVPFGAPSMAYEPPPEPEQPRCTIKDCPACASKGKAPPGGIVCVATGKKVYPPMSKAGARAMASTLLYIIGTAVKFFRKDKAFIKPTDREVEELADALREVASRRMGALGMFDDIFALGKAFAQYGIRAGSAPDQKPAQSFVDTGKDAAE